MSIGAVEDAPGLLVFPAEAEFAVQVDAAKARSEASLDQFADEPGVTWRAEARLGDPAGIILCAAADLDTDVIVMASTGKGAFARLMRGSVADRIART